MKIDEDSFTVDWGTAKHVGFMAFGPEVRASFWRRAWNRLVLLLPWRHKGFEPSAVFFLSSNDWDSEGITLDWGPGDSYERIKEAPPTSP